ncbi:expressed unknown protein [Seminavis robusta]|uniref:2Fe-2S ferredoxin-type domain-containing protein n=1 Tax=Seminavis robusta TaxID=568900 RepID=A0A9N8HAP9_9STRA|nr:expressed unknown protein [Seminavis robusta]|eukprot:Sro233_g094130.1 n/a (145) ;mRNA; f:13380-13814
MLSNNQRILIVAMMMLIGKASAFVSVPTPSTALPISTRSNGPSKVPVDTQLDLFGNGGFSFGSSASASATKEKPKQRVVTVNGKPVPSARTGQKILAVAKRARVNIPTYCKRGACGTCTCYLNGVKVHACMEPLPAGRAEIQTM